MVASCTIMPASGPAGPDVRAGERNRRAAYALVKVAPPVISVLASNAPELGPECTTLDRRTRSCSRRRRRGCYDFRGGGGRLLVPGRARSLPRQLCHFAEISQSTTTATSQCLTPGPNSCRRTHPSAGCKRNRQRAQNRAIEPQAVIGTVAQNSSLIRPRRHKRACPFPRQRKRRAYPRQHYASRWASWPRLRRMGHAAARWPPRNRPLWRPALRTAPQQHLDAPRRQFTSTTSRQTFVAFSASETQETIPFWAWHLSWLKALPRPAALTTRSPSRQTYFFIVVKHHETWRRQLASIAQSIKVR